MRALIVEDDTEIAKLVEIQVRDLGYQADFAEDGKTGLARALDSDYAFIILDIMLPELEGIEVCKRIREQGNTVPILMLTGRDDLVTEILSLEIGADEYVSKPFDPLQLKARLKALLRRSQSNTETVEEEVLRRGPLQIDLTKRRVTLDGKDIELTVTEFEFLSLMAKEPGRPFSRAELNEQVYGHEATTYQRSVSSHINRLRNKIEPKPDEPTYIITVRGVGYLFSDKALN